MLPDQEDDRKRPLSVEEKWRLLFKQAEGPPMYRPEEYIFHLRKWFSDAGICNSDTCQIRNKKEGEELQNVNIVLTELLNVSELVRNLKLDLKLAHAGFVSDFVRHPNNGLFLLLDLLKAFQSGQQSTEENNNGKKNPKKTMADEHECLLALKHATRHQESVDLMMSHSSALYLIACCVMSPFSKSRIVALQLLIKVCESGQDGNGQVLKAMSTLRLRFGEPVRFKFLVGMLSSPTPNNLTFQTYCLSFLNKLLETCKDTSERVYLQCEMQEAGMDTKLLQKLSEHRDSVDHKAYTEAWRMWKKSYVDVESLVTVSKRLLADNNQLRNQVEKLKETSKKLEEEKCSLKTIEKQLSDQCTQLQHKVNTLSKMGSEESVTKAEQSSKMDSGVQSGSQRKGSDAMSISSEESPKREPERATREPENEVIVPQLRLRRPKYVWCPSPTTTTTNVTSLRSVDKDHMFQQLDNGLLCATSKKHYEDPSLNWTYPAVPLPIAVVTSGKSSLQAMPLQTNDQFHKVLFQRSSYPVPSSGDRITATFHV